MRRVLRCVGLGLLLVALPVALAQDKKADADKGDKGDKAGKAMPDKNGPKDKKEAIEKMQTGGQVTGKLTQWGASDKSFTVQVSVTYAVLNEGEVKALADAQVNLARARNPEEAYNARKAMLEHQSRLYTAKTEMVDVRFVAGNDMKVRTMNPLVFDDKGKPKKLTAKEKQELKGPDKSLPGYTADISDVHQDSYVTVYLPKKKPAKTNPKDEKGLADAKVEAVMLVIVADPPAK